MTVDNWNLVGLCAFLAAYLLIIILAILHKRNDSLGGLWQTMYYETDFVRLVEEELNRLVSEGRSPEEAWREAYEKYFAQHYSWAAYLTYGSRELGFPVRIEAAKLALRTRFHDKIHQARLPEIVPEV